MNNMNRIIYILIVALGLGLAGGCATPKQEAPAEVLPLEAADYHSRRFLMEPEELKAQMDEGAEFLLIEVNKPEGYAKGHLPGAQRVWRPDYANAEDYEYGGMRAKKAQMEALLSRLGASANSRIVLYDEKGNVDAARLWWLLRRYGHERLALLNGGKTGWELAGYPLSQQVPLAQASTYHFSQPEEWLGLSIEMDEVLTALQDTQTLILDTRTTDEYVGAQQKKGAFRAGRIPGSLHIDWAEAVNYGGDFRFKTFEELKALYERKGATKNKRIIAYCHSGVRSAHTTFVLTELLGFPEVKNYDGSWTEWSYHKELPFETTTN
jgi:thiosulfate/3-mercaptopyruvate sulfurtransferase